MGFIQEAGKAYMTNRQNDCEVERQIEQSNEQMNDR